jgi:hypothetical protein
VHSHEDIVSVTDIAANESDVLNAIDIASKANRGEVSELRRKPRRGNTLDVILVTPPITDQVGYRDKKKPVLVGKDPAIRRIHHRADVVHHFAQGPRGSEPGEAGEVDRGLRVTGTPQHTAWH